MIEILSPHRIVVRQDIAIRTDGNGMSDAQSYRYENNVKAPLVLLRLNNRRQWKEQGHPDGSTYVVGVREEYYDYGF